MKTIITSALLATAVFCLAAPANNGKHNKHSQNTIATTNDKVTDQKKGESPQPQDGTTAKAKETKASKAKKDDPGSLWYNNNGGGRTTYH